ncbi:response regulator transcription factor [Anaerobranca gottschalkii]|uniref:Stage 0 sporulation protein A homolog n=1 Tax=Anaerobranca gottschalkii DSM 13577 TaxID=1120990 RepID=A0A1I0ALU9_9FIRM|nr:response regulator transcription factor [Anaerobranca gottschalkii]SES94704.1 DNA-binding response regulator, OmpR family, contains REC and winged-helix (wHTH) domain [Anaerobranca gottschalkii DSM 13577]
MDKKILIVEDDLEIANLIKDYLKREGFIIEIAQDGLKGLQLTNTFQPDLIILDIMLPKLNGFEICKEVRSFNKNIPIIIVSAKDEDNDTILGLDLGADDYITKPFSPSVLTARVKALMRRSLVNNGEITPAILKFQDLTIDLAGYNVFVGENQINLPTKEFELLKFLATHPRQVFTREEIYEHVWGLDSLGDVATVTVHVKRLRQKIEKNPTDPQYIKTVWGIGYKFEG